MIRIGILGDIGSGKSFVAKTFGYPVFNADDEVSKLYRKDRKIFKKLKKKLPNNIFSFFLSFIEDPWSHISPNPYKTKFCFI